MRNEMKQREKIERYSRKVWLQRDRKRYIGQYTRDRLRLGKGD